MSRWLLLIVFPCLVVFPPLLLLPNQGSSLSAKSPTTFEDDGQKLPPEQQMAQLAKQDPLAFLDACLRRYVREVKGYTLTFHKQERLNGKLEKKEIIEVCFREEPYSVLMCWKQGARLAARALYVEGENADENKRCLAVIKPAGRVASLLVKSVLRDPEGSEARNSGRYPISQFGLRKGLERTRDAWQAAADNDALDVEFLGIEKVEQVGGRECFVLKRTSDPEGDEKIVEQTIWIDVETWLFAGTVLRAEGGELVAEYWFRDVKVNPEFDAEVFTRQSIEG